MVLEKIRRRARSLGIKLAERMKHDDLIRAIQVAEGKSPCFDQQWCRPSRHQRCNWKHDCHARIEPYRGLILSGDVIIGHQIATLLSTSYGWNMQVVHNDREAYPIILQGNVDAVITDIDTIDLGGLAILIYAKHHWPSTMTYAITQSRSLYLKRLARDLGGCQGFFYIIEGRMKLDTHTGLAAQLTRHLTGSDSPKLSYVSTSK